MQETTASKKEGEPLTGWDKKSCSIQAVVQQVVSKTRSGKPYVVCRPTDNSVIPTSRSVTFHIDVWTNSTPPRRGMVVQLTDVFEFEKGWRAGNAEPVTPQTIATKEGGADD